MTKTNFFKNLSIILLVIVVILLIVNVSITKYIEKDERPKNREVLSGIEIDSIFQSALNNFGFSKDWIKKKKLKNVAGDSLYSTYYVLFPKDVPIHSILLELNKLFWEDDIEINTEEISSSKKSLIKIHSGDILKLAAECSYDENIKREYGTISFLVKDIPLSDVEILTTFLSTPEPFYVVLIPSELSKKSLSILSKSNRRFALLLDDNISELNYKLSEKYSDDKIKKSLKEIVGTFYNAAFFIIDDRSDLFESKKYSLIENELNKRGVKLVMSSEFDELPQVSANNENNFKQFISTLQKNEEKVMLLNSDEFSSIAAAIPAYRKSGFKFIYPGDLIIRK